MMIRTITILMIFSILFSCKGETKKEKSSSIEVSNIDSNQKVKNKDTLNRSELLSLLINKTNSIELPFYWDANEKYEFISGDEFNGLFDENYQIIGYLKKENYILVIRLAPADELIPVFTTFDFEGNIISVKHPIIGKCHGDCGYACSESTRLDSNLIIYSLLTATHEECDDEGVIQNSSIKASIKEAHGKIDKSGIITYEEGETEFFKPDSMEVSAMGFNSEIYYYEKDGLKQTVRLQIPSDSLINYWISFDSELCSSSFWGVAKLGCMDCDYEVDEYNELSYPSVEYFVDDNEDLIRSIRLAVDKTKLIIKAKITEEWDDCTPVLDEVLVSKTR